MDEAKVQCECELKTEGLEEFLVEILFQETIEGILVRSKIQNHNDVWIATCLSATGLKMIDTSQVREKITRFKKKNREFTNLMDQMVWVGTYNEECC